MSTKTNMKTKIRLSSSEGNFAYANPEPKFEKGIPEKPGQLCEQLEFTPLMLSLMRIIKLRV